MSGNSTDEQSSKPVADDPSRPLPLGYRQGLITAITVLLGFSLTFLRFWGFEAPGEWTLLAFISTGISVVAVVLQLIALFRSLQLEDDAEDEYRKIVVWFVASAAALLLGLLLALVAASLGLHCTRVIRRNGRLASDGRHLSPAESPLARIAEWP
jgi:hypothetical protein